MKLFIAGPVKMYQSTLEAGKKNYPYFRATDFSELMKSNAKRLSSLIGCSHDKSEILFLTMSGTGAMEATVNNCILPKDKVLVVNGGTFGHRFCELLQRSSMDYQSIDLEWNETLCQRHLAPYEKQGYTVFLVNLHETSSGKLYDIELISAFCKRNHILLIVDAISTFLADPYDMDKYGIAATIISSQKGLCCSAGMSVVALNPEMVERIESSSRNCPYYYDFQFYIENMKRGQTPFTPAVTIAHEIDDVLNLIDKKGGLDSWLSDIKKKCLYFREKALEIGLDIPSYSKSVMLTPVYFKDNKATEVVSYLRDKYSIYVTPCGGKLANSLLRVCHLGDTSFEDIDELVLRLKEVVKSN